MRCPARDTGGNLLTALGEGGEGQAQGGEHPQAKEVELDQADLGAVVLVPLEHTASGHGAQAYGADLDDGPVAQDHPAGVDPQVAGQSQKGLGGGQDLLRDVLGTGRWLVGRNRVRRPAGGGRDGG